MMKQSSRISRFFMTGLMILVGMAAVAQDSYREALKSYLAINQKSQVEKTTAALKQLNSTLFEYKAGVDFNQLVSSYIDNNLVDMMADMMIEKMGSSVSEADLREAVTLLSTPAGLALNEHVNQWSEQFEQEFVQIIQPVMLSVKAGTSASPVEANSDIPAAYAEKFKTFFDNYRMLDTFLGVFSQGMAVNNGEVPEAFIAWVRENLCTAAMNSAHGVITTEDLDCSAQMFSSDAYCRVAKASSNLTGELYTIGTVVILNYIDWMGEQGVSLSPMGKMAVNQLKQSITVEE